MDMQNVSNLVIPEGEVRTIHDKNSRLLWGKLSYDTKYAGNTIQDGSPTPDASVAIQTVTGVQTVKVTGKNLANPAAPIVFRNNSNVTATAIDTGIRLQDSGSGSNRQQLFSADIDLSSYVGKTVRMSAIFSNGGGIRLYTMASGGSNRTLQVTTTTSGNTISFTVPNTLGENSYLGFMLYCNNVSTIDFTNLIVTMADDISYEPYQSQSYTIDLGSTELCRIGNYQDYIYKSGDDWYVHKEIGKYTFTGTENWQTESYGTNSWKVGGIIAIYEHNVTEVETLCDYAQGVSYNGRAQGDATNTCVCYVNQNDVFIVRNTTITTKVAMQAATTGKDLYYKATPIDTKITDQTLIGQLNAVHQFLTRYGYNSIVSGNLPLIISKTNL